VTWRKSLGEARLSRYHPAHDKDAHHLLLHSSLTFGRGFLFAISLGKTKLLDPRQGAVLHAFPGHLPW
jgi:hypothetical protein